MTRSTKMPALAAALACGLVALVAAAAEDAAKPDLDTLCKAVAAYKFGQDEKPLIALAELVRASHDDAQRRGAIEERLVKLLETGTGACKRYVCRQLWMAASKRSVPALAKLLTDEELSNAARYALERLADPAAGAALREAMGKAKGPALVGVVNSLGHRRDKEAAALVLPLLGDKDQAVVAAAAWSLGRIGGTASAKALTDARAEAKGKLRRVLDDACLLCADALVAEGKKADAAEIYRPMYAAGAPRRIRIAALRGLMLAEPQQAAPLALAAMKGPDARIAAVAGALLRELPGEAITKALGAELAKLPADGQVTMLAVLAQRHDAAARQAVLAAAAGKEPTVRAAALEALGQVGTAEDVPLLADAACQGPAPLRRAAGASLTRLRAAGVGAAIVTLMKTSPPPVKARLIGVLAARWAADAVGEILACAADKDAAVRSAALAALRTLAGAKQVPALVSLVLEAPADAERQAAGTALASACTRAKDKPACAAAVLGALSGAPAPARCVRLRSLPVLPVAKSLAAVRAARSDAEETVRDAAVRALAEWPTADVLDDLLAVAAAPNKVHKVLALRGCVRVLALPAERPTDKTAAVYARLLKLADRPDERKLILAGLANVGHVDSLKLLEPLLGDRAVRAEAQAAAIKVASAVAGADHDLATATLEKIVASPANARIKAAAAAAIAKINQYRDYILAWMVSGPYTKAGKDGPALFDVVFPPEKPGAKGVKWRPISAAKGAGVDLRAAIGGDNRSAYLRTTIESPRKQDAMLEMGSDDSLKAWLNGKLIHATNASRSLVPGQDKVKVSLRAGENVLLLKVTNGGTDWGAAARVIGPDGKPIAGLKVLPK